MFSEAVTLTFMNEHNPDIYLGENVTLQCTQHIASASYLAIRSLDRNILAGCFFENAGDLRRNGQHFNGLATDYGFSLIDNEHCKFKQEREFFNIAYRVQVTTELTGSTFICELKRPNDNSLKHSKKFTFTDLKGEQFLKGKRPLTCKQNAMNLAQSNRIE